MITKEALQSLIDQIDTTGNKGTTGQELKDIFEAFKNDLYQPLIFDLTEQQIRSLGTSPICLLEDLEGSKFYDYFGYLVITQGTIAFDAADQIAIGQNVGDYAATLFSVGLHLSAPGETKFARFSSNCSQLGLEFGNPIPDSKQVVNIQQHLNQGVYIYNWWENDSNVGNGTGKVILFYKIIDLENLS